MRAIARERESQVISTRYPFRVDTGFLVRKRWEWTGFLARQAARAGARLARALSEPDFLAMSERFAGKHAKSEWFCRFFSPYLSKFTQT